MRDGIGGRYGSRGFAGGESGAREAVRVGGVGGAADRREAELLRRERAGAGAGTGTLGGAKGWYDSNEGGNIGWNADWGSSEPRVGVLSA